MATGAQIVAQAQQAASANSPYTWAGNPYLGQTWAQFRSDCSGLIDRIMANLGEKPNGRPTTYDLVTMGTAVNGITNAQPGDLLFFDNSSHVGVYVGNGQMIDDPQTGQNVKQEAVYATPNAIRRIATGTSSASSTAAGGVVTVAQAIKNATSDAHVQLAMALGALLEGGSLGSSGFPTGDNGQSPGPFQIRLYDNSGAPVHGNQITRAGAMDPQTAVNFMLSSYQSAAAQVSADLWNSNPEQAAEQTAFLAERPAQDYFSSQGQTAVDQKFGQAKSALAGTTAGGVGGTAEDANFLTNFLSPLNPVDDIGKGITAAVDAIKDPLVKFIENGFLIVAGVIIAVVGLVMLGHAAMNSGNSSNSSSAPSTGGSKPKQSVPPEAEEAAVVA